MEQGKKRRGPYRTYNKLVKAGKLPFPRSFLPEILKAEREAELKRTLQKESEGRGSSSRPNIEEPRGSQQMMATAVAVEVDDLLEQSEARLQGLGYCFAPCGELPPENLGLPARPLLAMRQVNDLTSGFQWQGQANYDAVGEAVLERAKALLVADPLACSTGLRAPLKRFALRASPLLPPPSLNAATEGESNKGAGAEAEAEADGAAGAGVVEGEEEAAAEVDVAQVPAYVYASAELPESTAPVLLLVCGAAPGGSAGVWGRALCVNADLEQGAMLGCVARAQARGWSVVVADPNVNYSETKDEKEEKEEEGVESRDKGEAEKGNGKGKQSVSKDGSKPPAPLAPPARPLLAGSESPHRHLATLYKALLASCPARQVLIVAHSYGASSTVAMLKQLDETQLGRIGAVVFTDAYGMPSWLQEAAPDDDDSDNDDAMETTNEGGAASGHATVAKTAAAAVAGAAAGLTSELARWKTLAPHAFAPPSPAVLACLRQCGRNYVACRLPAGTPLAPSYHGTPALSAGHESHPATTHAATAHFFDFLDAAAAGHAPAANDALRESCPTER